MKRTVVVIAVALFCASILAADSAAAILKVIHEEENKLNE